MCKSSLALPTLSLFWSWGKGLAQSHRAICSENHPEVRENHTMNFINEHVSSNFYSRQLFFNTPYKYLSSKNQLARIKVAGHVFINEIHRVVFPHFRVILRTDRPMAVPDQLPKKGKGRQRETSAKVGVVVITMQYGRTTSKLLATVLHILLCY